MLRKEEEVVVVVRDKYQRRATGAVESNNATMYNKKASSGMVLVHRYSINEEEKVASEHLAV